VIYPGTCRHARIAQDTPGAERFIVDEAPVTLVDRVQGSITQRLASEIGDFVVKRRDGLFAYQLAVVVDDADLGVTDVVRGADLLDSTARQVALQRALGFATPGYLHVPVATRHGEKLSKQTLAPAVDANKGAESLAAALRFLGQEVPEVESPAAMLEQAARKWLPERIPRCRSAETD